VPESRSFDFEKGEMLLFNKPLRWTSYDVVRKIQNVTKAKKVGHAGTLDPLATGLLIICTGKLTKSIDLIQAQEKEYTGTFKLGATTSSYDLEREIDQTYDISAITEELIMETVQKFIGNIEQLPPQHSAKKVDGKRAYELARKGKVANLESKKVTIHSFEITGIEMPLVHFKVSCSKGTYIRSLANDFGKELNSGAHLVALTRTKIGDYSLDDAWEIDDFVSSIKEAIPQVS
jgi:tRNA pseudouridine55 synthase